MYFTFHWIAVNDIEARARKLKSRFEASNTFFSHTRKYHSYNPIDESTIEIKVASLNLESKIVEIQWSPKLLKIPGVMARKVEILKLFN